MSDSSPTDPSSDELRRLLRTDELGVDPQQRESAIGAALAIVDELAAGTSTGSRAVSDGPELVPFAPRRDRRRLRAVATAAAVLLVFAGVASVIAYPLSQGSGGDSPEGSAAELRTGAPDSAAESQDGAGVTSDETISTTTVPTPMPADPSQGAAGGFDALSTGLLDLGEFSDAQAVIAAAPLTTDPDTAAAASAPAVDLSSSCGLVLSSSASVVVAVARLAGAPVLVARSTSAGGDGTVSVLSSPDCTLLASG